MFVVYSKQSKSKWCWDQNPISQRFYKWDHNWYLAKLFSALISIEMIQPRDNFVHGTTAQLSWHMQNCHIIWSLFFMSKQHIYLQDVDYELITPLWNGSVPLKRHAMSCRDMCKIVTIRDHYLFMLKQHLRCYFNYDPINPFWNGPLLSPPTHHYIKRVNFMVNSTRKKSMFCSWIVFHFSWFHYIVAYYVSFSFYSLTWNVIWNK